MVDTGIAFMDLPALAVTVIVGATVLALVYVSSLFRASTAENEKTVALPKKEKQADHAGSVQKPSKKKQQHTEKWNRDSKRSFTHPWMLTSLKGHTGQILDMDFSSNGKFLVTCADDEVDEGLDPGGASGQSSSSEGNKENSSPKLAATGTRSGLSRRQKKNRSRREDGSPAAPPARKTRGKTKRGASGQTGTTLGQHAKLNLKDRDLFLFLSQYILGAEQLFGLGYPVESAQYPGRAIIFKAPSVSSISMTPMVSHFDVNAQEFIPGRYQKNPGILVSHDLNSNIKLTDVPGMDYSAIGAEWAARHGDSAEKVSTGSDSGAREDSSSSGRSSSRSCSSSGGASPEPSTESEGGSEAAEETVPPESSPQDSRWSNCTQRQCIRCDRSFFVAMNGEYLTQERCVYHWGKLQATNGRSAYSCCKGRSCARGCSTARLHVWLGVANGVNGPLEGYVRTRPRKSPPVDGNFGVYAVDCEMCFTTRGLELARVTVVGIDGRLVYDCLVKPDSRIVDYNTRFSGITAKDFKKGTTKSLKEVQNDLMGFINSNTILVGHGLENDLRALRIMHSTIVDTSVVFPHYYGLPFRRSLKSLVGCLLKREIQINGSGHDSLEDARACIELMLWRVRTDFKNVLGNNGSW